MKGYPKILNSKEDIKNIIKIFPKEKWISDLQELLDEEYCWFPISELKDNENGIIDETHRVTISKAENGISEIKTQEELRVNPLCRMIRMGLNHNELVQLIALNS